MCSTIGEPAGRAAIDGVAPTASSKNIGHSESFSGLPLSPERTRLTGNRGGPSHTKGGVLPPGRHTQDVLVRCSFGAKVAETIP